MGFGGISIWQLSILGGIFLVLVLLLVGFKAIKKKEKD